MYLNWIWFCIEVSRIWYENLRIIFDVKSFMKKIFPLCYYDWKFFIYEILLTFLIVLWGHSYLLISFQVPLVWTRSNDWDKNYIIIRILYFWHFSEFCSTIQLNLIEIIRFWNLMDNSTLIKVFWIFKLRNDGFRMLCIYFEW